MRPHNIITLAALIITNMLMMTGLAHAQTYTFGGHTASSTGEIRVCTNESSCLVYLPSGWRLTTWMPPAYENQPEQVVSWQRMPAWGPRLDIVGRPSGRKDRCATTRIARYGLVKVNASRGCRRSARLAKVLGRKVRRGKKRGRRWRCRTRRVRMVCRVRGRSVRVKRLSAARRRLEVTSLRQRMTRCGVAHKIGTVTVWARGWRCSDVIGLGVDQAMRVGLHQSMRAPAGFRCESVRDALVCVTADPSARLVFQQGGAQWPGMRITNSERGPVWSLRHDPFA